MKLASYNYSIAYSFEVAPKSLENLHDPPLNNINKSLKLKILIILYSFFV
jgi:hypothetical protein